MHGCEKCRSLPPSEPKFKVQVKLEQRIILSLIAPNLFQ